MSPRISEREAYVARQIDTMSGTALASLAQDMLTAMRSFTGDGNCIDARNIHLTFGERTARFDAGARAALRRAFGLAVPVGETPDQ